jgi:hypothetical protein
MYQRRVEISTILTNPAGRPAMRITMILMVITWTCFVPG